MRSCACSSLFCSICRTYAASSDSVSATTASHDTWGVLYTCSASVDKFRMVLGRRRWDGTDARMRRGAAWQLAVGHAATPIFFLYYLHLFVIETKAPTRPVKQRLPVEAPVMHRCLDVRWSVFANLRLDSQPGTSIPFTARSYLAGYLRGRTQRLEVGLCLEKGCLLSLEIIKSLVRTSADVLWRLGPIRLLGQSHGAL